jgi:hypothetical protein
MGAAYHTLHHTLYKDNYGAYPTSGLQLERAVELGPGPRNAALPVSLGPFLVYFLLSARLLCPILTVLQASSSRSLIGCTTR